MLRKRAKPFQHSSKQISLLIRAELQKYPNRNRPDMFRSLCVQAIQKGLSPLEADKLVRKIMNY